MKSDDSAGGVLEEKHQNVATVNAVHDLLKNGGGNITVSFRVSFN